MSKILIIKVIIELILLSAIFCVYNSKKENHPEKKCFYKVLLGIVYMVTALFSISLVDYIGKSIYFYTVCAFIFSVGSFLSAINTNLREIYMYMFCCAFWLFIAYCLYDSNHTIIAVILAVLVIGGFIDELRDGIVGIINGLDPDEEEEKNHISKYKLLKYAFKLWKWSR